MNPRLKVNSEAMAVIPTESGSRKNCVTSSKENIGGDNFIVYLDANNGKEVNIVKDNN